MGIYFCNTTDCPGHTSFAAQCGVVTRDYSNYDYPILTVFKNMVDLDPGDSTPTEPVEIDTEPAEPYNPAARNKARIDFMGKPYRNKNVRMK